MEVHVRLEGEGFNRKMNIEVVFKPYYYSEIGKIEDVFKNQLFNGVIIVGASDRDVEYINSRFLGWLQALGNKCSLGTYYSGNP